MPRTTTPSTLRLASLVPTGHTMSPSNALRTTRNTSADQASATLGDPVDPDVIEGHRLNRVLRLAKLQRIIATLRDLIESKLQRLPRLPWVVAMIIRSIRIWSLKQQLR